MTRKKESGQALVFGVLALGIVLMGFAGLGIDVGIMRYEKRLLQTAADAAAIAGASNLKYNTVTGAAQDAVTSNGFNVKTTNNNVACPATVSNLTLTINNGPKSGPHSGKGNSANYVEVCVAQLVPTYFMRILSIPNQTVSARAVASNLGGRGNTAGCLFALGDPGVSVTGSAAIQAPDCGIIDNGDFNSNGNAFDVCAASFAVEGKSDSTGSQGSCGSKGVFCTASTTCPATGAPAGGDPLAYLTAPGQPANATTSCAVSNSMCCKKSTVTCPTGTTTLQPGTYSSINFGMNSTTTLASGIYYINGSAGVKFGGSATVKGTGVTFYFTGTATIDAKGGGNNLDMEVSAPTTGTYAGILMYQDSSDTSPPTLGGDNSTSLEGALYFPSAQLTLFGNANLNAGSAYSLVVAKALSLSGNPTLFLNSNYSGLPGGVSIIQNPVLVE